MRRYVAMLAVPAMAFAFVHPPANARAAIDPLAVQQPAAPAAEADALRQAQSSGRPVEVAERTTETTQVMANPNGTFTMTSSHRPVRVRKNGAWRGVDTTLVRNPDGSLQPVATDQDVVFSGGGSTPLITVRRGAAALAFSWPQPLPTPTINADTATYAEVLPGVDLQITAHADSYSQVLIVRDAAAATNPALARLRLTATGIGLTVTVTGDNRLSAVDPTGAEILHGAAPVMWDSRRDDRVGPAPTATDRGSGRVSPLSITATPRTAARGATTSSTELALIPQPAALTGPDVVYPLYIDPSMGVHRLHWTEVTDNGWHYYDDPNQLAQVGYCSGWAGCGTPAWRARSYFQMDISPLWPRNGLYPKLWRAQFFARQVWAADHNCGGGQPTNIYESGGIDAGTRWPGPAGLYLDTQYSNAGGPCPAANVVFNIATAVKHASDGAWASLVLALGADNHDLPLQWKQFDNNPLLEVDFSFPPNNATGLHVSNEIRCTGSVITPDANPALYATATDNNNPPLRPALWHHVLTSDGSRTISSSSGGVRITSGTEGAWQIPPVDRLSDGQWKFRVYVDNNPEDYSRNLHSPYNDGFSAWYPFVVDATPPSAAPLIKASTDYPTQYWGSPSGAPGAIPVTPNGADIVGYTYTFLGAGTQTVPATTDCVYNKTFGTSGGWIQHNSLGQDWIPIPAGLSAGYHTMHVRSFDNAHNLSPESTTTFYVAPHTGQTTQHLEAETLTRTTPAGQSAQPAVQSTCCNVSWSGGAQLAFPATAPGQSFSLTFPVTVEADYQLAIGMTSNADYGRFSVQLDGQPIGHPSLGMPPGPFDGYNPITTSTHQPLGARRLAVGTHILTVTSTGTNSAATGLRYRTGIDYLDVTPTPRYETENSSQVTVNTPPGQSVTPTVQTTCCSGVSWSQGAQLSFPATAANTSFDLTFRAPIEADYALGAGLTKARDYGRLTLLLDDNPLNNTDTAPWDGYNTDVTNQFVPLGGVHLTAGSHKLTVKIVGTNPASSGNRYQAGVDYLSAVPVNNVTAASFADAMNNDGIISDTTPDSTLPRTGWTATADSQDLTYPGTAAMAIDGNPATIWHTQWATTATPLPHTITIDMHTTNVVSSLRYLPRGDGSPNGTIGSYQLHLSTNGTTWGNPVATGTFPDNTAEKTIAFPRTAARYLRLTALTEAGNRGPWSTAAELNITGQPATGANGFDLGGTYLSAQTLAAAGYPAGQTATINGARFTIPTPRADGADNVIALGQTIPFPTAQQVQATAVGLLVTATCGTTPPAAATITYTDGFTTNITVGPVDDWTTMPTDTATFVLPYRNGPLGPEPTNRPRVRAQFLPTDPTKTLKSITLPNYRTSMVPGSCSPALHVLAMAPRPVNAGWIGAWTAPADTTTPPPDSTGLANQTLRSVIRPSVTGESVRIRITNPTNAPVTIDAASLAAQTSSGAAALTTPTELTFAGTTHLTLPAGAETLSDPIPYPTTTGGSGNLLVSLHLPTAVTQAPVHHGVLTYLGNGNLSTNTTGTPFGTILTGSSYLSGLDVSTTDTAHGTVVVLGDQTSAIGPITGDRSTWTDYLPATLDTAGAPLPGGLVNASRAGQPANQHWLLNDGSGTTAANTAPGGQPATLNGQATWSTDHGGCLTLTGTGDLTTNTAAIHTTSSYTISAWVRLPANTTTPQTILSQDGTTNNAFALQYTGTGDSNKWAFTLPTSNTTNPTTVRVLSATPVTLNTWTHLIGTYDATTATARLYINGQNQGSVSHTTPFPTTGPFAIGRGKLNGTPTARLTGSISDIHAFPTAATDTDAAILYRSTPITGPQPGLHAPTAANAPRDLDRTTLNQAQPRTVIITLGANDILAGRTATTITQDLTTLMHAQSPTGLRNTKQTDGSPIHLIITTVAPLGLAANDPREIQRQQLNTDLLSSYTNYGADEILDLATLTQDPNNPNQLNPSYLDNTFPNPTYHTAIATALADAATRFPPEITL